MSHSPQDVHKKVLGKKGETLAAEFFKKRGCKLLHKNYRTPFGEADIVLLDGDEVAFVEVKTRTSDKYGTPAEAVVRKKRQTYQKIAKWYWMRTGEEPNARFDVAEVYADGRIEYIKYAY